MSNKHEILKIENIRKIYQAKNDELEALKSINLKVNEGEFVSIIGPSGCGKSTLLSIIAGLEEKTSGKIYIDNEEIVGVSRKIGYMLQKDSLLEWRSIYQNIMIGLEIQGIKNKENEIKSPAQFNKRFDTIFSYIIYLTQYVIVQ